MLSLIVIGASLTILVHAQGCPNPLFTSYQTPSLAESYGLQLLTQNITNPRQIIFDSVGNLLISGDPIGIMALAIEEFGSDGCLIIREQKLVVENGDLDLNHGISLSPDGKTL